MRIKVRGRRLEFDPSTIEWRHQSSPQTQFGLWESPQGRVFVKRFSTRPPGWKLLEQLKGFELNNSPKVIELAHFDGQYFAFFDWLEGEILSQILQRHAQGRFLGSEKWTQEIINRLFLSIYGFISHLNQYGFWYPDLDFRNIFISHPGPDFRVHLIDLDSCIAFGQPADPHQVSQRFWEGLVRTYLEAGKSFLKKDLNGVVRGIQPHGRVLNQSMLLLLAYALQRLGKVPTEAPLYTTLINPQHPLSEEVRFLHSRWLGDQDCREALEKCLSDYLKLPGKTFKEELSRLSPPPRSGFRILISKLLGI